MECGDLQPTGVNYSQLLSQKVQTQDDGNHTCSMAHTHTHNTMRTSLFRFELVINCQGTREKYFIERIPPSWANVSTWSVKMAVGVFQWLLTTKVIRSYVRQRHRSNIPIKNNHRVVKCCSFVVVWLWGHSSVYKQYIILMLDMLFPLCLYSKTAYRFSQFYRLAEFFF